MDGRLEKRIPSMNLQVFGKCILAGEHTVLRKGPALIFPVYQTFIKMDWERTDQELVVQFEGDKKEEFSFVFWGVLERALNALGKKRSDICGRLNLSNTVPIGSGLGASAALCVGVGRFLEHQGFLKEDAIYEFCRNLENIFHGESSGADIAAALYGEPIVFQRPQNIERIQPKWYPKIFLSHSGHRGVTAECVKQVKDLFISNQKLAQEIDDLMRSSVEMMIEALMSSEETGMALMTRAITQGYQCFQRWGLSHGGLDQEVQRVLEAGALAAKPTGSGRGGYVLSLWKKDPPQELLPSFIPLMKT